MNKKLILVTYDSGGFSKTLIDVAKETEKQYRDKFNSIYSKDDENKINGKWLYSKNVFAVLYDEEKQFEDLKGKLFNYELSKLNRKIEGLEKDKTNLMISFYKEG